MGKKSCKACACAFCREVGLKKIHAPKLFHPPSHKPVRPLLTFIMEKNFGNETSGHPINIYTLLDSYNEHADS